MNYLKSFLSDTNTPPYTTKGVTAKTAETRQHPSFDSFDSPLKDNNGQMSSPLELARRIAQFCQFFSLDLADYLQSHAEHQLEQDQPAIITPAQSIIGTCRRLGISLRVDADRRLVLGRSDLRGKEPAIPLSLAMSVEAHTDEIIRLLQAEPDLNSLPSVTSRPKAQVSPYVSFVFDDSDFGPCEVCGDPAALVLPWKSRIGKLTRFCSGKCIAAARTQEHDARIMFELIRPPPNSRKHQPKKQAQPGREPDCA